MAKRAVKKSTKKTPKQADAAVRVKSFSELSNSVENFISYNLHERMSFRFSKKTQKQLVAYGPWLSVLFVGIALTELMIFAKDGKLIGISGFFNSIFFNQESWVILLILFTNIMLLVDGHSYLFEKKPRGWSRIYQAALLSTIYITFQLFANITEPAPAILSLLTALFALFTLFDIRSYYMK